MAKLDITTHVITTITAPGLQRTRERQRINTSAHPRMFCKDTEPFPQLCCEQVFPATPS
jgi:hypothetical protein